MHQCEILIWARKKKRESGKTREILSNVFSNSRTYEIVILDWHEFIINFLKEGTALISSIRIGDCLRILIEAQGQKADKQERAVRETILEELRVAIRRTRDHDHHGGRIVVQVPPRRFQLYGQLQVFKETPEGQYRLELPYESWIVSDRNLSPNELLVSIESSDI
jgi:hypothetical protein